MLRVPGLSALPGIVHGFFTREGGVSGGIYASLNCGPGSKDARVNVVENRRRVAQALGVAPGALATAWQHHGTAALDISEAAPPPDPVGRGDALVTSRPGVALGVLTADCAPVLLADAEARIVGAAHAGWRGALDGILEAAVAEMERQGAARGRIRAAIGPCIGFASYEVGPEFPAPFLAEGAANAAYFAEGRAPGKYRFDLASYVRNRLVGLGVAAVEATGGDTCADDETLFSYRRSVQRGEPDYGRAISAIALVA